MSDSTEVKKQIIQDEIMRYENTVYLWTIRVRVAKKIEDKTLESTAMTELEKCEKSIDVLNEELKSL